MKDMKPYLIASVIASLSIIGSIVLGFAFLGEDMFYFIQSDKLIKDLELRQKQVSVFKENTLACVSIALVSVVGFLTGVGLFFKAFTRDFNSF